MLAFSGVAGAQDDPFAAGVQAYDEGRFDDALTSFVSAYELRGNPQILLNVAAAQTQLGRLASAAQSYRRLLDSSDPRAVRHRALAAQELASIEPRLARAVVSVSGAIDADELSIDERGVVAGNEIELDAGEHRAAVRRGAETVAERTFTIGEGDRRVIELEAPAAVITVFPVVTVDRSAHSMLRTDRAAPITESPWLWLGIGAGVLVVAGLIVGVVVATNGTASPQTYSGSFEPGQLWVH